MFPGREDTIMRSCGSADNKKFLFCLVLVTAVAISASFASFNNSGSLKFNLEKCSKKVVSIGKCVQECALCEILGLVL